MITEKIITFEKETEITNEAGEKEKKFIQCEEKEATHRLIRRKIKDRPCNQELPTIREKIK